MSDFKEEGRAYINKTIKLEQAYNLYLKTKRKRHLNKWYNIMNKPIKISK